MKAFLPFSYDTNTSPDVYERLAEILSTQDIIVIDVYFHPSIQNRLSANIITDTKHSVTTKVNELKSAKFIIGGVDSAWVYSWKNKKTFPYDGLSIDNVSIKCNNSVDADKIAIIQEFDSNGKKHLYLCVRGVDRCAGYDINVFSALNRAGAMSVTDIVEAKTYNLRSLRNADNFPNATLTGSDGVDYSYLISNWWGITTIENDYYLTSSLVDGQIVDTSVRLTLVEDSNTTPKYKKGIRTLPETKHTYEIVNGDRGSRDFIRIKKPIENHSMLLKIVGISNSGNGLFSGYVVLAKQGNINKYINSLVNIPLKVYKNTDGSIVDIILDDVYASWYVDIANESGISGKGFSVSIENESSTSFVSDTDESIQIGGAIWGATMPTASAESNILYRAYNKSLNIYDGTAWFKILTEQHGILHKGTTAQRPSSRAQGFVYYDTTLTKIIFWDGSKWIDSLGYDGNLRSKGTTAQRPTPSANDVGFQFFDTTISKPIFWNGTKWVDSTGADA